MTDPWLIISIIATVVAAAIIVAYRIAVRRHHDPITAVRRHDNPAICFYLHDDTVMNIYLQGDYKGLNQEIEERSRDSSDQQANAQVHGVGAHAGRESEREKIIKYIKAEEPITVIRTIIAALDDDDVIVYVDLLKQEFEPGDGLDRALAPRGKIGRRQRSARSRDLDPFVFVSIKGRFRVTDKTDKTTTFAAPYGDPTDPATEPRQVSVTCVTSQLRREDVPSDPFPARCIGKIQRWDSNTQQLVIDPVLAIFQ